MYGGNEAGTICNLITKTAGDVGLSLKILKARRKITLGLISAVRTLNQKRNLNHKYDGTTTHAAHSHVEILTTRN